MQMKTMKKYSPAVLASDDTLAQHAFPKKIFQTWDDCTVPVGMFDAMQSWIQHNPDWGYHLFDDDDIRLFIQAHFSSDVVSAYDQLVPGAYRADLWRYCVLYIHGGVYADAKLICHQSLQDVLPAAVDFITVRDVVRKRREFPGYLWQAFMVAKPGLALFKIAIDRIVQYVEAGYYGCDPLSITGPGLLGKALNVSLGRAECAALEIGRYETAGFICDLHDRPGLAEPLTLSFYQHRHWITAYAGYSSDRVNETQSHQERLIKDYPACWMLGQVYRHGRCVRDGRYSFYRQRAAKFFARQVRAAYVTGDRGRARALFRQAMQVKWFNLRLFIIWLRYAI